MPLLSLNYTIHTILYCQYYTTIYYSLGFLRDPAYSQPDISWSVSCFSVSSYWEVCVCMCSLLFMGDSLLNLCALCFNLMSWQLSRDLMLDWIMRLFSLISFKNSCDSSYPKRELSRLHLNTLKLLRKKTFGEQASQSSLALHFTLPHRLFLKFMSRIISNSENY